jgi:glutathionylspermidine synthase
MINTRKVQVLAHGQLQDMGWAWLTGQDALPYVTDEMVRVSPQEAENYAEAANTLYEMYVEAAQYAIDHQLLNQCGIPANLHEIIQHTWNDDLHHWHLYGRFDLAGGLDDLPIKLIEFNANTATCIPETALVQAAQLVANGHSEAQQFNTLFEALTKNFSRLKDQNPHLEAAILFSGMEGFPEDDANLAVLAEAAVEAGFFTQTEYINKVEFSEKDGVFRFDSVDNLYEKYSFWFSLVPWEFIGTDEPELASTLSRLIMSNQLVVVNPPYTLLLQSKYLLKILWDLFPNHPLLLPTSDQPLANTSQVEKVIFGREGANVSIKDKDGNTQSWRGGEYASQPKIYQAFVDFPKDAAGHHYQAGVFYAFEACGLAFRRGGQILDNQAQFCGHIIEPE